MRGLLRPLCIAVLAALMVAAALGHGRPTQAGGGPLVKLAEVGPWSAVSALIGFGDRLWLANSVRHVNHNSCDLYSYDPVTGTLRYERHLFSQDAGTPAVLDGRLYWPFEDARGSAGIGEFLATDGTQWDWRQIPGVRAFHAQAFHADEGTLHAGLSAWQAVIARSDDGGVSWRIVYRHTTEERRVSRITAFATLGGRLFAGLTSRMQLAPKLLVETEAGFRPLHGWPESGGTSALTAFDGWVYGVNWNAAGPSVWRTDGKRVERVEDLREVGVRAFAATARMLYAISAEEGGGTLWKSTDGEAWQPMQRFEGASPEAIAVYAGKVYVGTAGPGERGALWGPLPPAPVEPAVAPAGPLPQGPEPFADQAAVARAFAALDDALSNPQNYDHAFAFLTYRLSRSHRPTVGVGLEARLDGPFPIGENAMFGGALKLTPREVGRWYLLRAMGLSGHGRVPPALIAEPFRAAPNEAEKYVDIAPLAAWVAGELGQDDKETIAALIGRLGDPDDPPWLDGDLIGALTALTGERFGYDLEAWRRWWRDKLAQSAPTASSRSASARSAGVLTLKKGSKRAASYSTVATP
jgi:hypothetical protein